MQDEVQWGVIKTFGDDSPPSQGLVGEGELGGETPGKRFKAPRHRGPTAEVALIPLTGAFSLARRWICRVVATRYTLHAARRSGAVIAIVLSRGGREHGLGLSVVGAAWQVRGCTALLRL